jgi:hypothetical protein
MISSAILKPPLANFPPRFKAQVRYGRRATHGGDYYYGDRGGRHPWETR